MPIKEFSIETKRGSATIQLLRGPLAEQADFDALFSRPSCSAGIGLRGTSHMLYFGQIVNRNGGLLRDEFQRAVESQGPIQLFRQAEISLAANTGRIDTVRFRTETGVPQDVYKNAAVDILTHVHSDFLDDRVIVGTDVGPQSEYSAPSITVIGHYLPSARQFVRAK